MKAIRVSEYGGPSVLKLEEIPTPQPAPNQVLVRNRAVGVNPVDTYLRSNTDNRGPKLPYTPGSDSAGVVEAVGGDVKGVKAGDRVYVGGTVSGAYAELSLCTEAQVHPLPSGASFAQGAAVNVPYATAYQALFNRARRPAGESVLVHGASGGVGIGAVQLARARGITVIGTAGTERGPQAGRRAGRAPRARPHRAGLSRRGAAADRRPRRRRGDGDARQRRTSRRTSACIAMNGRIVVIGNRGTTEINARHAMNKNAAILGMALGHATPRQLAGIHAALGRGARQRHAAPGHRGQEIPLAEAAARPRGRDGGRPPRQGGPRSVARRVTRTLYSAHRHGLADRRRHRRHLHGPGRARRGHGRRLHQQGAQHAARSPRRRAPLRRPGGRAARGLPPRHPRHDHRHQCAPRANRGRGRASSRPRASATSSRSGAAISSRCTTCSTGVRAPLVPRGRCLEVPERLGARGEILVPLDEDAVKNAARRLAARGRRVRGGGLPLLVSRPGPRAARRRDRRPRAARRRRLGVASDHAGVAGVRADEHHRRQRLYPARHGPLPRRVRPGARRTRLPRPGARHAVQWRRVLARGGRGRSPCTRWSRGRRRAPRAARASRESSARTGSSRSTWAARRRSAPSSSAASSRPRTSTTSDGHPRAHPGDRHQGGERRRRDHRLDRHGGRAHPRSAERGRRSRPRVLRARRHRAHGDRRERRARPHRRRPLPRGHDAARRRGRRPRHRRAARLAARPRARRGRRRRHPARRRQDGARRPQHHDRARPRSARLRAGGVWRRRAASRRRHGARAGHSARRRAAVAVDVLGVGDARDRSAPRPGAHGARAARWQPTPRGPGPGTSRCSARSRGSCLPSARP